MTGWKIHKLRILSVYNHLDNYIVIQSWKCYKLQLKAVENYTFEVLASDVSV